MACLVVMLTLTAQESLNDSITIYKKNKPNKCLFQFVSDVSIEYGVAIQYIQTTLGVKVLGSCEKEKLIYVELNDKYRKYSKLFAEIEEEFIGKCLFKSDADIIIYWGECEDALFNKELKE